VSRAEFKDALPNVAGHGDGIKNRRLGLAGNGRAAADRLKIALRRIPSCGSQADEAMATGGSRSCRR
jgi:hypothetical protein